MESKDNNIISEYKVGTTLYQVTPVFREASDGEQIAEKIQRLILNDNGGKSASQ